MWYNRNDGTSKFSRDFPYSRPLRSLFVDQNYKGLGLIVTDLGRGWLGVVIDLPLPFYSSEKT